MTVDQALARIMEIHRSPPPEAEMRAAIRKILSDVRFDGYCQGSDETRFELDG